jgi:glycerol-3-phosphate acyltransferase PlsY
MGAAGLTFAGDVLKGFVPVIAARWAGFDTVVVAGAGLAAALGAMWSIFLGFRGGRGVSAGLGVWLGISPLPVLIAVAVFAAVFAATRIVSLGSISAAIALVPAAAALGVARPYLLLAIVMSALVLVRHRANIGRLIRGEEPTFLIGHPGPP